MVYRLDCLVRTTNLSELTRLAARLRDEGKGRLDMCDIVFHETGLFPHSNPGTMYPGELAMLHTLGGGI